MTSDHTVDHDERLKITDTAAGTYDVKICRQERADLRRPEHSGQGRRDLLDRGEKSEGLRQIEAVNRRGARSCGDRSKIDAEQQPRLLAFEIDQVERAGDGRCAGPQPARSTRAVIHARSESLK